MKRIFANLILLVSSLALAFAAVEVASRYLFSAPQLVIHGEKSRAAEPESPAILELQQRTLNSKRMGGLYRKTPTGLRLSADHVANIKSHRISGNDVVIETNSLGYRNREVETKSSATRVLFLGDSITLAGYLSEADTFVRRVETLARNGNKNWETINAGVGAISLKNELAILLETGIQLKPDVVVLGFYLNDFLPSAGVEILELPGWMTRSWFLHHLVRNGQQLLTRLTGRRPTAPEASDLHLRAWRDAFEAEHPMAQGFFNESPAAFNRMVSDAFYDFGGSWSQDVWEFMRPLFDELVRLSREHEFRLVIAVFPVYHQVYTKFETDYPQRQVLEIGRELEVPVLDLLPPLRRAARSSRGENAFRPHVFHTDLFYDQCHHTPTGSAVVAEALYSFLSEQVATSPDDS
jgi:hypothetical protein